jgi:hypothetical protein
MLSGTPPLLICPMLKKYLSDIFQNRVFLLLTLFRRVVWHTQKNIQKVKGGGASFVSVGAVKAK